MGGFFSIVLPLFLFNLAGKMSAMLCRHFSMKMSLLCGKFNYFLLNVFYANIFHQNERQQQIHERHGAVDNDELGNSDHNNNNNSISTKKTNTLPAKYSAKHKKHRNTFHIFQ